MSRAYAVGDVVRWGRGGDREAGVGREYVAYWTGRVVAVVPPGVSPGVFRASMPPDLARRWSATNRKRLGIARYVVEVDGVPALQFPHPDRFLDDADDAGVASRVADARDEPRPSGPRP